MKLTLPRPYRGTRRLDWHQGLALDYLRHLVGPDGIGPGDTAALLARHFSIPEQEAARTLAALLDCRVILLSVNGVAISAQLSAALRSEREANRKRLRRGAITPPCWELHEKVRRLFPSLRARLERPATYTLPAAYASLLAAHPHAHKRQCPADVEILTEACYAGELQTVLTMIAEQQSARREPFLLYTRKALYVGVRRHPKR